MLVAAALALAGCGGGGGGGSGGTVTPPPPPPPPPAGTDQPLVDATVYSSLSGASLASATDAAAITHHQIVVGGTTLSYTATTGHLVARELTSNTPQASFFYVAYTLDGQNAAQRPITFFYNGGPGSASVWLHLGSFGPKRLATGIPSTSAATPFPLVDNAETMLDVSDLVFVDAVGSGYSQAIAPRTNQSFWSVDSDAAVFRDFVRRYAEVNGRAASPKFLFGESYGTTRSAVLAKLLESAGTPLAGVILQSSILDYRANCAVTAFPVRSCVGYLPSYSASGAWYALLNPNPSDLPSFIEQIRVFARDTYAPAVSEYLASNALPLASVLADLVNKTGIVLGLWQSDFNLDPDTFQAQLVPGTLIGRYDSRVSAPVGSALAREGDPSSTFITASFASTIRSYLVNTLQYTNASTYVLLSNAINTWDFSHDGRSLPDTIPDLATALAINSKLRVLSVNGYHDLATPFYQTELDIARLGGNPRVAVKNYSGGHMTYLDDASRALSKTDLQAFYRAATQAP
jgi:carboxypeptidase C (cathepsin A)